MDEVKDKVTEQPNLIPSETPALNTPYNIEEEQKIEIRQMENTQSVDIQDHLLEQRADKNSDDPNDVIEQHIPPKIDMAKSKTSPRYRNSVSTKMQEMTPSSDLSKSLSKGLAGSSDNDMLANTMNTPYISDVQNRRYSMYQSMTEFGYSSSEAQPIRDLNLSSMSHSEVPYSGNSSCFSVSEPIKGNPVTYMVRGIDEEGPFEASRRYNDFYNFYKSISTRWPGIYIPPIPPKKAGVNKDEKNLKERRIFLEKFIKVLSENEFLVNSEEFKIFSRHNGNIEKVFKVLPRLTSELVLKRFQT